MRKGNESSYMASSALLGKNAHKAMSENLGLGVSFYQVESHFNGDPKGERDDKRTDGEA